MAFDNEWRHTPETASACIPLLRTEATRLSNALATCSAQLRIYQIKVDAVLDTLAPNDVLPVLSPPPGNRSTTIEIGLMPGAFDMTEALIARMQEGNRNLSVDDCLNTIFTSGLSACLKKHFPAERNPNEIHS